MIENLRRKNLARHFGDSKAGRKEFARIKAARGADPFRPRTKDGLLCGDTRHAFVPLELKMLEADDGDELYMGRFEGWGSVFGVQDSYDEIVEPGAFTETIQRDAHQFRTLWQHCMGLPVGVPDLVEERMGTEVSGLRWGGRINATTWGKDAWISLKTGAVTGLSIGYRLLEYFIEEEGNEQSKGWPIWHLTKLKLYEVSLVTYPANPATWVDLAEVLAGGGEEKGEPAEDSGEADSPSPAKKSDPAQQPAAEAVTLPKVNLSAADSILARLQARAQR